MRYRRLRFDIWFCLLLGFLVSLLAARIAGNFLPDPDEVTVEEHTVAVGDVGSVADESVYRVQSVEDMLAHDTFTIVSPGLEYCNRGAGFYHSRHLYAVTLPSGELVAALINTESVVSTGEYFGEGDSILPVGRVVFEDLTQDEYFINQIEYKEPLSRTDFYVDMRGEGGTVVTGNNSKMILDMIQVITTIVFCIIFHIIGAKLGIFPNVLPHKNSSGAE